MTDRLDTFIALEILLGNVRRVCCPMHQHVVPGFVLRGARTCDRLVPLLRRLKRWIDIDDHATIVEQPVVNQVADGELRSPDFRHSAQIPIAVKILIECLASNDIVILLRKYDSGKPMRVDWRSV